MKKWKKAVLFGGGAVVGIFCLCAVGSLGLGLVFGEVQTRTPTAVITQAVETATPRPTETPIPQQASATPPAATETPTTVPEAGLPGLWPADVTLNFEPRGLTCGEVEAGAAGYYTWTCEGKRPEGQMTVTVYSRSLTKVDLVEAVVLTEDQDFAAAFLGFAATMPYDGAEPEAARAWVEEVLPTLGGAGDVREAVFGGVRMQLYGSGAAYTLEIGSLK